nr:4Fe-4S binding protein [Vibrio fluminensis]
MFTLILTSTYLPLSLLKIRSVLTSLLSLIFWLLPCSIAVADSDITEIPPEIIELFPSATRIAPAETDLPVIPVFQLSELLGYVFQTDDLTDFVGFSGDSINLLIGLDTQGHFSGLKVLSHHEPIFLHGLGEKPMMDFVQQYQHHSVKEQYIIGADDKALNAATYFNGVSRATVSILVIHDTIIASALKVARNKLQGFTKSTPFTIDDSYFESLDFQQLLDRGYLIHWQTTPNQIATLPTDVLHHIQQQYSLNTPLIDLYIAFLDIPIVGKNLLGEAEFKRLQDNLQQGEHAVMFINRGQYSYISEEFIPQTLSERLSATQDQLPVELRDIDFYSFSEPSFATEIPVHSDLNVFRIKSQSGFELQRDFELSLSLIYEQNYLNQKQYPFTQQIKFPPEFFVEQVLPQATKNTPLWVTIWQNRVLEIALLSLYLLFISALFVNQRRLAKHSSLMHQVRLLALIFTLGFVGFYSQGQLSVVNIYTLLHSLYNGFQIEVFLLDPIIFLLWCFVFSTLFLWGRGLFCGWLCPFGALQELMALLATKLKLKQWRVKHDTHRYARLIKYALLFALIITSFYSLTVAEQLSEVEPFKTSITLNFIRYWPFTLYALGLLFLGLKIHKFYCRYLCPLGAGLAILGRYPLFKWLERRKECGSPCHLCRSKKCGIDAINLDGSINYSECVQCMECLVTIKDPSVCVVNKYGRKNQTRNNRNTTQVVEVVEP